MRWFFYISLFSGVLLLSGCSLISTGEYFTVQFEEGALSVNRADWVTDTIEPSFGHFRPPLKQASLGDSEKTSIVVYPIIICEKAISFGPAFLPLIPVFDGWQDPPSEYSNKIRLLFKGARSDVERLGIFVDGTPVATQAHESESGEIFILSEVLNVKGDQIFVTIKLGWGKDRMVRNQER